MERVQVDFQGVILDVGCGSGRVTAQLLEHCLSAQVIALDPSQAMVAAARERLAQYGSRVDVIQADILSPPGALSGVDTVFSTAAFHWINDHDQLFRTIAGLLRPGGQLVAQWGGENNIEEVLRAISGAGGRAHPWTFASVEETKTRLNKAGFEQTRVWAYADPENFGKLSELERFLDVVILHDAGPGLRGRQRREFVRNVANSLPDLAVDYVRLNADAQKA